MAKLLISLLALVAAVYTLFVIWMVWFSFAYGFELASAPIGVILVLCAVALSPIPVSIYSYRGMQALRRGEQPRL